MKTCQNLGVRIDALESEMNDWSTYLETTGPMTWVFVVKTSHDDPFRPPREGAKMVVLSVTIV